MSAACEQWHNWQLTTQPSTVVSAQIPPTLLTCRLMEAWPHYTSWWYTLRSGCETTTVGSPGHGTITQTSGRSSTLSNTCHPRPTLPCLPHFPYLVLRKWPTAILALPKHVSFDVVKEVVKHTQQEALCPVNITILVYRCDSMLWNF